LSNNQLASLPIEIGKLMIHINLSNNMLPTLIKMAEQDSIRIKNNTRKKNNIRIRTIVDKQPIKKQKRISYQEKEYVIVSIYDRKQVEDQNDNFKKHNNYLALWRNGFITKNNVYSFYIETKYEFTIYALILAGIVGGIIFYRKKRRLYQWLCWGIAGITVLAVVGLYGYLLLA
jgi:hypothetical protein